MSKLKTRRPPHFAIPLRQGFEGQTASRGRQGSQLQLTKVFLFLTILLAPLYVVRFNVGPYPSTLLEVLVGLTFLSWVADAGVKGLKGLKNTSASAALFLVAAAISVVVSPDKRGALGVFKAYFVEPILIYLVIKDVIKSKRDWRQLLTVLGLSGLWVALLAIAQELFGWPVFAPHEAALGRAHSVYNTANAVGLYVGPIMFLLLGSLGRFGGFGKAGIIGGIGIMVAAILLSKSTGAMVGLVTALLVASAYFLLPKKWVIRVMGGIAVTGVILGVLFFLNISNFTPQNADPYVRESTDTLQFRLCLWEGARNLLLDNPVFGAGLSGFKELYSQKYFTCDAEPLEYPHNWVLNFWAETGILGLLGFVWVFGSYFRGLKGLKGIKEKAAFAAAMLYWLVHGLVDVPYFKNDLALEFWVIVGLLETLGNQSSDSSSSSFR